VLVDNRAGAATTVFASNFVAKAAPDGYTIYAGGTSADRNPGLDRQRAIRPATKLRARVADVPFTPFILHVNADFPHPRTMAE